MRNIVRFAVIAALGCMILSTIAFAEKDDKQTAKEKYDLAFESALTHYEKATLLYKKDKVDETVDELVAITNIEFPNGMEDSDGVALQLDAYSFLGEIYMDKGDNDSAVKVLKEGIKKAPEISRQTYQLYMTLGHALKLMKNPDDALDAFDKAQKINDVLRKREKEKKGSKK